MTISALDTERFEQILRWHLKYLDADAELGSDAPLKELGLDSMQAIDLLFDIEEAFGVILPDEALNAETFATAATLRRTVAAAAGLEA